MRHFKLFLTFLLLTILGVGNVWGDSFTINFYDSSKLSSTSGTGLTNNNYSSFVSVADGLTATNVVTGVSVIGTIQYGKNGGLTFGTSTAVDASSHKVTFSIGNDYKVTKCTVYATAYETGRILLNGNAASSGSLAAKGTAIDNITTPYVWTNLNNLTSLEFTKDNGSGGNQKRITIYKIVCEYSSGSTETTALSAPTGLSAGTPNATGTTLTWDQVDNAGSYKVEYKVSTASSWTEKTVTTTSCELTGLTAETEYTWQVTAIPTNSTTYSNSPTASGTNFTTAAFIATAGTYNIVPGNGLWGTSYTSSNSSTTANGLNLSGTASGVSFNLKNGSSTSMYVTDTQVRVYNNYTLKVTAPTGFNLTKIVFTADGTNWTGTHTASVGTMTDNKTWDGKASEVTISFKGTCRCTNIAVTYAQEVNSAVTFANPTNGTLAIKKGENTITTGTEVASDEVLTVTATPSDDAYRLASIKVTKTTGGDDVTSTVYNATKGEITMPDYAITVSATMEDNNYTVTFHSNTTPEQTTYTQTYTYTKAANLTANTFTPATGYEFYKWAKTADGEGEYADKASYTLASAADAHLYAKWTPKNLSITLDKNGSTADGLAVVDYDATAIGDIDHVAAWSGHELLGYYTASTEGIKVLNADGTFAGDVEGWIAGGKWAKAEDATLYAHWKSIEKYTISYDLTGCTADAGNAEEIELSATAITLNFALASTKYTWTDAAVEVKMGGTAIDENDYTFSEGELLIMPTDGFTGNIEVIILCDYAPATLTLSAIGNEYNFGSDLKVTSEITLPSTVSYEAAGKTFMGWSTVTIETEGDAPTSNFYTKGAKYTIGSTTDKLYAVYATETAGAASWNVATSIAAGDVVVIATNTGYTAQTMKTAGAIYSSGSSNPKNLLGTTASTFKDDKTQITSLAEGTIQFTVGGTTDAYTLKNGYQYLAMDGDKSINFQNDASTWKITFSGNVATVSQLWGTSDPKSTYKIQYNYNSGTDRFVGYTSNQVDISLFKKSVEESTFTQYTTSGTIHVDAPEFDELTVPGTYTDADHTVMISVPTGATVYYTLDGTAPTNASTQYDESEGITLSATATVKAIAYVGENYSEVLEGLFTINNYSSIPALTANVTNNTDVVLNLSEAYVLGVKSFNKQVFVQMGGKGIVLTMKDALPEGLAAGKKLTAAASGTFKNNTGRPQINSCVLSANPTIEDGVRPTPTTITAVDETTIGDNLLTLVKVENLYSISKTNDDIVMNTQADGQGTAINLDNYLGGVASVLPEQELACNVIGVFNAFTQNGSTTYSIYPVLASDFALVTPKDAVLPTVDVVGSTDSENPLLVGTNKKITITRPATGYTGSYSFNGAAATEMTAASYEVTITNTDAAESLTLTSTRPYYTDKSVTYYYKADPSENEYNITYPSVQTYVGISGAGSSKPGETVELTGTSKVTHYAPGEVTVSKADDETTTVEVTKNGNTYTFTMPEYNVTVKIAYIKDPTYSITYQTGGKQTTSGSAPTEGVKFEGDEVTLQANTWTANNYIFASWKVVYITKDALEQDVENPVTVTDGKFTMPAHDVKIIAQWTPVYSVTYDKGAATEATGSVTENPQKEGATVTLKANGFTATGYSFIGWKANTDGNTYQPGETYTMTAAAVTFTAQWDEPAYKKPGAWELVTDASELAVGDYIIFAANSDQTWYAGSSKEKNANKNLYTETNISVADGILTYNVEEEKTINDHIFVIEAGNETGTFAFYNEKISKYLYAVGNSQKNYLKTDASKASVNASWSITSIASNGEATVNAKCESKNLLNINTTVFSAYGSKQTGLKIFKFYPTARKVSFDANAGEDVVANMPSMVRANPTTNIAAIPSNVPTRTGYTFSKWNSAQAGNGTRSADPNGSLELWQSECTMYAVWTKNTPALTVASVEHGTIKAKPYEEAEIAEGNNANVEYNKSVVISYVADDEEYAFKAWKVYKSDDESEEIELTYGQTSTTFNMPDYPVTVSAVFESKASVEYTLTYDANGGEGTMAGNPFTKNWNNYITVSDNKNGEDDIFTKTNCVFNGWNTKADGTGTAYAAGAHFYIKSDVTLYAQWRGTGATYYLDKNAENNIRVKVGAAPQGATATCVNSNASSAIDQATADNSITITLSGYAGMVIKNISAEIKANASDNGTLDITVGGNSVYSKTYPQLSADNQSTYQSRSFADYGFQPFYVDNGQDIVIVVASTYRSAYIQNITVEYAAGYGRDVTSTYGTICLEHGVDAGNFYGATFYEGDYLLMQGGQPYKYYLAEVDHLEAGMPYVFVKNSEASQIAMVYNSETSSTAYDKKGLVGTLSDIGGWDAEGNNILTGNYFIKNGEFRKCGVWCGLSANRAYLNINNSDVVVKTQEEPASVGGRKRIALINSSVQTPTSIDGMTEGNANEVRKVMIDNKIYIIRGDKMFSVDGRLVK